MKSTRDSLRRNAQPTVAGSHLPPPPPTPKNPNDMDKPNFPQVNITFDLTTSPLNEETVSLTLTDIRLTELKTVLDRLPAAIENSYTGAASLTYARCSDRITEDWLRRRIRKRLGLED